MKNVQKNLLKNRKSIFYFGNNLRLDQPIYSKITSFSKKFFCSFKNTISLNSDNFQINKKISHTEIIIKNLEDYEIQKKKFLYEKNNADLKQIVGDIQKEYNILFTLDEKTEKFIINELKPEIFLRKNKNLYQEINDLKNLLKINSDNKNELNQFYKLFENTEKSNLKELKKKYFLLLMELEKMEKIKSLIDLKVNFRINFIFVVMISLLTAITGIFFYCIYYIEELGWDLVEPTTYLFSSLIYLACLFGYIKLQRKGLYSSSHLYDDLKNHLRLKRYIMYNFNFSRYNSVLQQKKQIFNEIEKKLRI